MSPIIEGTYFVSVLSFLGGLKLLGNPKKAKIGNILAGTGMLMALLVSLFVVQSGLLTGVNYLIVTSMLLIGGLIGKVLSQRVEMTQMPQLVSLFNATGGACALFLGLSEANLWIGTHWTENLVLFMGIITGSLAASGSVLAFFKLSGKVGVRKSFWVKLGSILALLAVLSFTAYSFGDWGRANLFSLAIIVVACSLIYGVLFVLPIGGADMPVVISLLNAITGVAAAMAGALQENKIMLAGGIIVGASGVFLTIMMCKAMNRSLIKVISGSFNKSKASQSEEQPQEVVETNVSETALQLSMARKVAIIPGYGLAVAQAHHLCQQVANALIQRGAVVDYIIHPVAGRMPGHMNVLLAEAKVEYELQKEMAVVNDSMESYDLALVIGANDVVNPAAENNPESPIYGMPIIRVSQCSSTVVLKRGMNKGYAGVANELFSSANCKLLFGDAKSSLQRILDQLKLT